MANTMRPVPLTSDPSQIAGPVPVDLAQRLATQHGGSAAEWSAYMDQLGGPQVYWNAMHTQGAASAGGKQPGKDEGLDLSGLDLGSVDPVPLDPIAPVDTTMPSDGMLQTELPPVSTNVGPTLPSGSSGTNGTLPALPRGSTSTSASTTTPSTTAGINQLLSQLGPLAGILGPVIGAFLSHSATTAATAQVEQGITNANKQITDMYDNAKGMFNPFVDAGQRALTGLENLPQSNLGTKFGNVIVGAPLAGNFSPLTPGSALSSMFSPIASGRGINLAQLAQGRKN